MEEKKFDVKSIIGLVVVSGLMIWMMYNNIDKEKQSIAADAKKEVVAKSTQDSNKIAAQIAAVGTDSTQLESLKAQLGSFAYAATLPAAQGGETVLENEVLKLTISNKGGYIKEAVVKNEVHYATKQPISIIKDGNADLNMKLKTADNKTLQSKDLFFEPTLTKDGENQVLTMQLKAGPASFLEYRYVLKPNEFMLDFGVRTQGMSNVINTSSPLHLEWQLKAYKNEKSVSFENRYTDLCYEYEGGKDTDLGQSSLKEEVASEVTYVAFKQHYFASILLTDTPIDNVAMKSENLVQDEKVDTLFTKNFTANLPLVFKNGELNYAMNMYYGPSDYNILNKYDRNLDEIVPLGWGIFGFLNRYVFIPLFSLITAVFPYGLAIIVLTFVVRLVMSPVTYKSYLSQAKMKALRPEINAINEKFAKEPMKKQQETMKLYNSAGVNPMAGCIPALMQIPIFYSLFQFFPSAFDLRGKSFLWAEDLSSYDSVLQLPFHIPFYGNHVSLFPILASIAIFFYMKMTTGDQAAMAGPQQEGMPDMGKIMKIMIYISPIMMLFFFNNNPSGLSLYYFVSNLLTIGIMWVIKNKIVKEDKIKAIIAENKTKDKPKGKFAKKMQELMEQAEAQQKQNKK